MRDIVTPETLRELLTYDPDTGHLFWKPRPPTMFHATAVKTPERQAKWWRGVSP